MTAMNDRPDRLDWDRIHELFADALELAPTARRAFLDAACAGQPEVRAELDSLLAAHELAGTFLSEAGAGPGGLPPLATPPLEGERVGPWRVLRLLGRGGMGAVYLAERADGEYQRQVALKLVKRGMDTDAVLRRFLEERQILARLEHPGIARFLDAGATGDGRPYFVMERIDGQPLIRFCDERGLGLEARLHLFCDVCRAVQYAHQNLVVHRDLKPSNILVTANGQVKLLDFGIAKLVAGDGFAEATTLTVEGIRPLTPEYAAPEQLRGEPVTTAADVYSLGAVLYELVTGRTPYRTERRAPEEMLRAVAAGEPPPPSRALLDDGAGPLPAGHHPVRGAALSRAAGQVLAAAPAEGGVSAAGADLPAHAAPAARATTGTAAGHTGRLDEAARGRWSRRLRGDLDTIVLTALRPELERRYPTAEALLDDIRRFLEGRPVGARPDTTWYRTSKFIRRHRVGVLVTAVLAVTLLGSSVALSVQQRQTARERDRAELEAARSRQVLALLTDIFEVSDPDFAPGDTITARTLLDRAALRLDDQLAGEPALHADMLSLIGQTYQRLGLFDAARPLQERALTLREVRLGPLDPEYAANAEQLASLLLEQGELERAEELARHVLAVRQQQLGAEDTLVASSLATLAAVRGARGDFTGAEELQRAALAIERRHGSPARIASSLSSLGVALYRLDRFADALPFAEEAVALRREIHGPLHTDVATSLMNLAVIVRDLGDFERAEAMLQEVVAMRRRLLGDEHPHVAIALNNLSGVLFPLGRLDDMVEVLEEALAIRTATLGADHVQVGETLNQLGVVNHARGNYVTAADYLERALAIFRTKLGDTHPYVLSVLSNLGAVRREQGDLDAAERALREALELRREALGEAHPSVASSHNNIGIVLARRGEYDEAEANFRRALDVWREAHGPEHPLVATAIVDLADMLLELDRCAEAEPLLGDALAIRQAAFPPESSEVANARLRLGQCLVRLGRPSEAEPLLLASHEALRVARGEDHNITLRARAALAELYTALGRPEDARRYSR
jgi:eukaryotic-like serine/threonine-protein kinase